MSHFAKVENGIVTEVILAEKSFIDSGALGNPSDWVETTFGASGNKLLGIDGVPVDGVTVLRKNYARIGFVYDSERDAFYSPQPHNSWTLNEETCMWEPPIPIPEDNMTGTPMRIYSWNEDAYQENNQNGWTLIELTE